MGNWEKNSSPNINDLGLAGRRSICYSDTNSNTYRYRRGSVPVSTKQISNTKILGIYILK